MSSKQTILTAGDKVVRVSGFVALLAMSMGSQTGAMAAGHPQPPTQFSGLLNDYTPTTVDGTATGAAIKGAPYEMHGRWTLIVN